MNEITIEIKATSKKEYRKKVIHNFLDEECGNHNKSTIYCYYVEKLKDNNRIYLKRPTALNKGVDFEVRVENTQFRYGKYGNIISTGNRPSHSDIYNDLVKKANEDRNKYDAFFLLVTKTYNCEELSDKELTSIKFENSHDSEMVLKVLKWLFIEQDVTYWNHSGRYMLFNSLSKI